ncbi:MULTISPECIES: GGDEF domain-containing protein [Methylobacillus]|uniref:Diguanylate cyclase (GGDEF domain) n=1 Tax=Methylobacillus flagellatus (strain ATCC 51484 / DSM 6875 / VKM B-1610 / KT) TaxID=265072 RepID=Q1H0N4_METFK|nr:MULTISPECIES: GGDEF domain-containing protein [Methylobacillus]ABE49953.1 diguanylate cyclase (GGDEF domain) [Methylobacillus flagellatus KT]MPS48818.1 diguanylate cyclase [Methylobacillus sp.]
MPISQNLLWSASLRKWTLSFENERLEALYQLHAISSLRRHSRLALVVGAVMMMLYGLLDPLFVKPDAFVHVWYIRAMVVMLFFAVFWLSFYRHFLKYNQLFLGVVALFSGLGLLAQVSYMPVAAINFYYTGLVVMVFWTYTFSGLRFFYSTLVGILLFLVFNVMFLFLRPLPLLQVLIYDVFILSANVVGGFASYVSEKQSRELFLREKDLDNERQRQQERALHDRLTGLPNRELLLDRIEQAINFSVRNNQICAGLFIDLDRFKPINDTYGHLIGDIVLKEVATRLKYTMREADTLARLGGDEFFVLARDIGSAEAAEVLAEKLKRQFLAPIILDGLPPIRDLSASIGICVFPYRDASAVDVIRRADHAMYDAKRESRRSTSYA